MRVLQLWRYPVKSMGGERLDSARATATGLEGDRLWGIVDLATGRVLTARREPKLFFATARFVSPEKVAITLPSGEDSSGDDDLSAWLGRPVELRRAGSTGGVYENPMDFEREAEWVTWQGPSEAWHDSGSARVSLVSTATIGSWDVRRFRPNVLLDGQGEDDLIGSRIQLGSAVLDITKPLERCVMVTRPQPGLEADLDVLRTINRERASRLAIGAVVHTAGVVRVGDVAEIEEGSPAGLR